MYNLNIFIYASLIQAAIVIVILIATYVLYFFYKQKINYKTRRVATITKILLASLNGESVPRFKLHYQKLIFLLLAIKTIDANPQKNTKAWETYKIELTKKYLLPLARKKVNSSRWFNRLLAAKTFVIHALPEDERLIGKLIQDSRPTITFEVIQAIKHLPTEYLINLIIDEMATYRRKSYDLFLLLFKDLPETCRKFIITRLSQEKNPYKRDICYRILMYFKAIPFADTGKDAASKVLELRLSAIRFLAYSEGENALTLLQEILKLYQVSWETKIVILQTLTKFAELGNAISSAIVERLRGELDPCRIRI